MDKENQLATIPTGSRGLILSSMDDMVRFAEGVVRSQLAPKSFNTPAKIVLALQTGSELGIGYMQSLQKLNVIEGKVTLSGDLAAALIQASGKAKVFRRFYENEPTVDNPQTSDYPDNYRAVIITKRVGSEHEERTEFSIADAKQAGLWMKKSKTGREMPWTQYWKRMLMYRCIGFHSRDYYGDVTLGMVVSEELNDYPVHDKPNCATPKRADRKPVDSTTVDGSAPDTGTEAGGVQSGADKETVGVMLKGCINKFKDRLEEIREEAIPLDEVLRLFRQTCWENFGGEISQYAEPEMFTLEMITELNEIFDQPMEEPESGEPFDFTEDEAASKAEREAESDTVDKTEENVPKSDSVPEEPEMTADEVEEHLEEKLKQWKFKCLNKNCKEPLFDVAKGTVKNPICPTCLGSNIQKDEDTE